MEASGYTTSVPAAVPKRRGVALKPSPLQSYILKGMTRQQNRRQIPEVFWFQASETDTSQGNNLFTEYWECNWFVKNALVKKITRNKRKLSSHTIAKTRPQIQTFTAITTQWMLQLTPATLDTGCMMASIAMPARGKTTSRAVPFLTLFFVQQLIKGSLGWMHVIDQLWV